MSAAFKRRDREGYFIRPTLPAPWGRVGPWHTGFASKRQAEQVEAWLVQMAMERPGLIDALVSGKLGRRGLQSAWVAKLRGSLDDLLLGLEDPPLEAACQRFAKLSEDGRVRNGLADLYGLAAGVEEHRAHSEGRAVPKATMLRLSWLTEHRNVNELYAFAVEEGRAPNSVKRSIHRAVADLLSHHYGRARRDDLLVDVKVPGAADEREVRVTSDEIGLLLTECEPDFADLVALAMLLAVDRGPLLRIAPRYFDEAEGSLEVLDRKTSARPRTIELSTPAWAILRRRCTDRQASEPIFSFTESQVRHHWEAARDRAAGVVSRNRRERGSEDKGRAEAERLLARTGSVTLPLLRFKDLRHLLPTAWNALGFSQADLQEIIGHAKGSKQTGRYITTRVSGDRERMDKVAAFLGLDRLHLKASGE